MFRARCDLGALFLTADFLAPDDGCGQYPDGFARMSAKKRQRFQPIEDLVTSLDMIASGAVAA